MKLLYGIVSFVLLSLIGVISVFCFYSCTSVQMPHVDLVVEETEYSFDDCFDIVVKVSPTDDSSVVLSKNYSWSFRFYDFGHTKPISSEDLENIKVDLPHEFLFTACIEKDESDFGLLKIKELNQYFKFTHPGAGSHVEIPLKLKLHAMHIRENRDVDSNVVIVKIFGED